MIEIVRKFGNGSMFVTNGQETVFCENEIEYNDFVRNDRATNSEYYALWDSDSGRQPIINLNRYDCDTLLKVYHGIIIDGFVDCPIGYHSISELIGKNISDYEYAKKISKETYRECWENHINNN